MIEELKDKRLADKKMYQKLAVDSRNQRLKVYDDGR
jgi:hypothetical protein